MAKKEYTLIRPIRGTRWQDVHEIVFRLLDDGSAVRVTEYAAGRCVMEEDYSRQEAKEHWQRLRAPDAGHWYTPEELEMALNPMQWARLKKMGYNGGNKEPAR